MDAQTYPQPWHPASPLTKLRHGLVTHKKSFVMAASRGSANRPPRICSDMMRRALKPTGKAERPSTGTQQILGGRFALPRDAAMTRIRTGL